MNLSITINIFQRQKTPCKISVAHAIFCSRCSFKQLLIIIEMPSSTVHRHEIPWIQFALGVLCIVNFKRDYSCRKISQRTLFLLRVACGFISF